ncbi:RraA family protein (plasmid) [Agrobacterium tumefaciens]|uniref:Putative 4-hydroxy-4-methyl-2-oxoglutarate aldolase n=1 Tax=Agrobacterium tumefaciens TaxID=358 RepID=A0AAP9E9Q3_AGRTU|nr:RraA family protein [Agrobacterium tumefaciens]NSZ61202.1 RraA family protein [Agrobacterium tumefaciens]QDY97610.1 RraA family protein [Agrobacterium tumefaciens]UXS12736.1 RraA family protein [Agrobacterium tumefaciens]UXS20098.1 RraA family protein [Agrobacterium tumefaciens]UXS27746.1 RraA family protein [Agrobacterium tumefaciens]
MIPDLSQVETATLGHFLVEGFMAPSIQALVPGARIWGPALTVRLPGTDGAALAEALSVAKPGEVIVVDRCGDLRHACFGAVTATAAKSRGVAGVVIDGFVTDLAALLEIGVPVWCRGRSPITTRNRRVSGNIRGVVSCGGSMVSQGDIILADESGVVVLDPATAAQHAATALKMQHDEISILERLRAGETLKDITAPAKLDDDERRRLLNLNFRQ